MIHAYAGERARARASVVGVTRHAADSNAHLCGAAIDTECGKPVVVHLGEWDPNHADNCRKCSKLLRERSLLA